MALLKKSLVLQELLLCLKEERFRDAMQYVGAQPPEAIEALTSLADLFENKGAPKEGIMRMLCDMTVWLLVREPS